jgi:hypothetical protein
MALLIEAQSLSLMALFEAAQHGQDLGQVFAFIVALRLLRFLLLTHARGS